MQVFCLIKCKCWTNKILWVFYATFEFWILDGVVEEILKNLQLFQLSSIINMFLKHQLWNSFSICWFIFQASKRLNVELLFSFLSSFYSLLIVFLVIYRFQGSSINFASDIKVARVVNLKLFFTD